jgi:hypothetical protein
MFHDSNNTSIYQYDDVITGITFLLYWHNIFIWILFPCTILNGTWNMYEINL